MQWQSGLSWAKRTDSGRVGYKYGQICRECGINERDGKTIYVRPFELVSIRCLIFLTGAGSGPWIPVIYHVLFNLSFRYLKMTQTLKRKSGRRISGILNESIRRKTVKCASPWEAINIVSRHREVQG